MTLSDVMASTAGYDVDVIRYITDVAINASGFGDVMTTTTTTTTTTIGYDVNGSAIDYSGLGGSGPSLSISGCLIVNTSALQLHNDSSQDGSGLSGTRHLFNRVKGIIVLPTLFLVGFPSNCLNLLVFFKLGLERRINLCLFCLSLVDLVYITFLFTLYAEQIRPSVALTAPRESSLDVLAFIMNNHILGFSGFAWASMFVSAIIASERCLCVVWPLRSGTLLKTDTTAAVLLVGVVVIAGGRFAVTEKYRVLCLHDVESGREAFVLLTASRYYLTHRRLVDVLDGVVYGLVVPITTCGVVALTTIVTGVQLRKVVRWRRDSSSSSASASTLSAPEVAVTRMLIYLSVQFVVLNFPNVLLRVASVIVPDLLSSGGRFSDLYYLLIGVVEVCMALSASLNVLVYYLAGSRYRETVHGLCGKADSDNKKKKREKAVHVVHTAATSLSKVNTTF